jgi:hypothetical protein
MGGASNTHVKHEKYTLTETLATKRPLRKRGLKNTQMHLTKTVRGCGNELINMTHDRGQWWALVNTVKNFWDS